MSEVWKIEPLVGVGPLKLGMSRAEVDALTPLLGPIEEEVEEETTSSGRQILVEYRSMDAPECVFEGDRLTEINIGESDLYDFQFNDVSVFQDKPRSVFKAFAADAAGQVYWMNGRLAFPKLSLQVDGCVEYIEDELIFRGERRGSTFPKVHMAGPGAYDEKVWAWPWLELELDKYRY